MNTLAVIGLGYVGLPLVVEFGKQMRTIGFDIAWVTTCSLFYIGHSGGLSSVVGSLAGQHIALSLLLPPLLCLELKLLAQDIAP